MEIHPGVSATKGARRAHAAAATISALVFVTLTDVARACPNCATSQQVKAQIAASSPGTTLAVLTLAFSIVAAFIVLSARAMHRARRLFGGALLLGAGLGAFMDGILLHQVLQWHAMLSSVVVPTDFVSSKVNMFWDGIFHVYAWVATVIAITIVVRELPSADTRVRSRGVAGGAVAGWGIFNLVEGVINHQIFGLHHVHPGLDQLTWDIGFLLFGVVLVVAGAKLSLPVLARQPTHPRT